MLKNQMKNILFIIGITISLSFLYSLIWKELSVRFFLDGWFLLSLLLFLIGAAMFITERGFFQGITYSFRRFFSKVSRQGRYAEELFGDTEHLSEPPVFSKTAVILYAAVLQLVFNFFIAYLFI